MLMSILLRAYLKKKTFNWSKNRTITIQQVNQNLSYALSRKVFFLRQNFFYRIDSWFPYQTGDGGRRFPGMLCSSWGRSCWRRRRRGSPPPSAPRSSSKRYPDPRRQSWPKTDIVSSWGQFHQQVYAQLLRAHFLCCSTSISPTFTANLATNFSVEFN